MIASSALAAVNKIAAARVSRRIGVRRLAGAGVGAALLSVGGRPAAAAQTPHPGVCCVKTNESQFVARVCAEISCPSGWDSIRVSDCADCPPFPLATTGGCEQCG